MAIDADALYSTTARGRWRLAPEAVMRAGLARQSSEQSAPLAGNDTQMFAYCEVCLAMFGTTHEVIADPEAPLGERSKSSFWYATQADGEWQWHGPLDDRATAVDLLGMHEHNEDLEPGVVRFYVEHPTGGFKTRKIGGWDDVVESLPLQTFPLWNPPTYRRINEVLASGGLERGRGVGGVECPAHQFTESEWIKILRHMFEIGRFIKERPPSDLEPQELRLWEAPYLEAYRAKQRDR